MTTTITLALWQLAAVVAVAVGLASTDAAAISRLAVASTAKKAGIEPGEIMRYNNATDE